MGKNNSHELNPTFVIGVPRSGTTLLRTLIDSHSKISAPSETPWITGSYVNNSFRHFLEFLSADMCSPAKNLCGVERKSLFGFGANMIMDILILHLEFVGKEALVLKTPDDINFLEFIVELFPKAKFIHIVRDGRDVACSSVQQVGQGWGTTLNGEYSALNIENALERWLTWESNARAFFKDNDEIEYCGLKYEELVRNPHHELGKIFRFLGFDMELSVIDYSRHPHHFPSWEAGSRDVSERTKIELNSIGRWRSVLTVKEKEMIKKRYQVYFSQWGFSKD